MNTITLKADGLIVHEGSVASEPLVFLPFKVELEEGYTLRSYFEMLRKYALLTKLSFFFPACMKQYSESPPAGCTTGDFDYLRIGKTVEMLGFPGEPKLEIYISFNGISGSGVCELNRYRFAELLDMPVRLGRLKHIVFGDKVDVFEFETVFTLFEIVDGICWELSFQAGSAECRLRR